MFKKQLEKNLVKHLVNKYGERGVEISNNSFPLLEIEDWDIDMRILKGLYGDFKRVKVSQMGVFVFYR